MECECKLEILAKRPTARLGSLMLRRVENTTRKQDREDERDLKAVSVSVDQVEWVQDVENKQGDGECPGGQTSL